MVARSAGGGRADTFDASQFGILRYDFTKFGGKQGTIDDPSDEMIEVYLNKMREIAKEFGGDDQDEEALERMSAEELAEHLEGDSRMQIVEAQKQMAAATAILCRETPSEADLLALPFRVRQRFQRWLSERLLNPESEASDGVVSRLRRLGG